MTALGQLAPEFLVVSSNPTRMTASEAAPSQKTFKSRGVGDNARFERQ
jgi:hypothetical protein